MPSRRLSQSAAHSGRVVVAAPALSVDGNERRWSVADGILMALMVPVVLVLLSSTLLTPLVPFGVSTSLSDWARLRVG